MKIGDTIWVFDANHRIYRKDPQGRSSGGPIWKEHWVPRTIVGETTRSWLVGEGYGQIKVAKKGANPHKFIFSEEELEDRAYAEANRYGISGRVSQVTSGAVLRAIVKILDGG